MSYTLANIPNNLIYEKDNQIIITIISQIKDFFNKIQETRHLIKNRKELYNTMDIIYNNMADLLNYVEKINDSCETEKDVEQEGINLIKYDDKFYNYLQEIYTNCYDANEIIKQIDISKRTKEEQFTSMALIVFNVVFELLLDSINNIKFRDIIDNAG